VIRLLVLPVPGVLAVLAVAAAGPALRAGNPRETTAVYRLRGEVRPFLFWIGRGDVGGGHITVRRTDSLPGRWSQEIEVLFGSDPARVPQHINRWGYGRESANWTQGTGAGSGAPRLLATDFQRAMDLHGCAGRQLPQPGAAPHEVSRVHGSCTAARCGDFKPFPELCRAVWFPERSIAPDLLGGRDQRHIAAGAPPHAAVAHVHLQRQTISAAGHQCATGDILPHLVWRIAPRGCCGYRVPLFQYRAPHDYRFHAVDAAGGEILRQLQ